jgi:hypothetical protein
MGEKKFIGLVRELITEMKKKQILINSTRNQTIFSGLVVH